jgi:hypothetical protein
MSDTSVTIGLGSQASVAVGTVNIGVPPVHAIAASVPCPLRVGGVMSSTVMVWLTVPDWLPQASVALQVIVRV